MAIIRRGKNKGNQVEIQQYCNDWVSTKDGKILGLTALQFDGKEFTMMIKKPCGMLFNLFEPNWDNLTFKKRKFKG